MKQIWVNDPASPAKSVVLEASADEDEHVPQIKRQRHAESARRLRTASEHLGNAVESHEEENYRNIVWLSRFCGVKWF